MTVISGFCLLLNSMCSATLASLRMYNANSLENKESKNYMRNVPDWSCLWHVHTADTSVHRPVFTNSTTHSHAVTHKDAMLLSSSPAPSQTLTNSKEGKARKQHEITDGLEYTKLDWMYIRGTADKSQMCVMLQIVLNVQLDGRYWHCVMCTNRKRKA